MACPAGCWVRSSARSRSWRPSLSDTPFVTEEMVVDKSRPLTAAQRKAWETARRKPGRPRRGAGAKVISVSVERRLLARSDALAKELGVSRASLIERGLRAVLEAGDRL